MSHSKGFTLAEMAVAVVILAILLFGAMVPFSTQVDIRNLAETRRTMDSIKEAIIGFTQANGRLPCPALGTTPTAVAGAGTEQFSAVTNTCTATFGVVPWVTLSTPETDTWNRRFSYWVSPIFADAPPNSPPPVLITFSSPGQTPACAPTPAPIQSSFALCSLGIFTVNTRNDGTHAALAVGNALPAVFISHGKNGYGAFIPSGVTLPAPTGADETANANHSTGATNFFSRSPTAAASGCNDASGGQPFCEFDDIVVMISSNVLIARMVAAGKLP